MHYRSMILAALAILLLTGLGCSERDVFTPDPESLEKLESPIVGGQPTADFEHAVALYHGSSFICSGTLVTPTAVVTAAHCLDNVADPLRVFFGVNALKPWKGVVMSVVSYEVHPQWDPVTLQNDIAVVVLEQEVPIAPAILLGADQLSPENVGDKARFVGYGAVSFNGAGAGKKRYVDIDLIALTPTTMRYADPVGNTCYGDSGGGGYIYQDSQWKLAGVTSYGDQWCQHYGVSTRTDAYVGWLAGLIGAETSPTEPDATELTVGQSMGGSLAAGEDAYYWFPTFDDQRYDVFVENHAGDVDLYVSELQSVSDQTYSCASTEAPENPEYCNIPDGGSEGYWVLLKANAASLFRIIYTESDSSCHASVNGEVEYCTAECPCAHGEGDCNGSDDACALGLRCMDDAGPLWDLAEGVHVCEFPTEAGNEGPLP